MSAVRVEFTQPNAGPERLVADAAVIFEDGPMAGLKLVGFSVWTSREGETFVTFPSRAFGFGSDKRYFDFLRSVEGTPEPVRRIKGWILEAYRAQGGGAS